MPRTGRPTAVIELTETERETLQRWARRHKSSQAHCGPGLCWRARRARPTKKIAQSERVNPATVSKWRRRFAVDRLEGLGDAPRPGAVRTVADETVEAVLVDTLESTPGADTHWSTRGVAKKHGISKTTVAEIWRAFGLKPWQQDSFKVSPDPDLVEKVRDLVGLYMNPPDAAAVFAVDEKPQIQALNRTAPILPMLPTTPQRTSHDYERNGTVDLFAALDIARGTVITDIRKRHTQDDFIAFLNKINRDVPDELAVHVILDNLSTHKTPKVKAWLPRHERFHFHFTATYGSGMNMVERWFSALTTKKLQRSAHRNPKELAADILARVDAWERKPYSFRVAQVRRANPRTPRRLLRRHQQWHRCVMCPLSATLQPDGTLALVVPTEVIASSMTERTGTKQEAAELAWAGDDFAALGAFMEAFTRNSSSRANWWRPAG